MNVMKRLENFVINENESIYKAHWKLHKNGCILVVLDDNDNYQGVLTFREFNKTFENEKLSLKEIVNKNGKFVAWDECEENMYEAARNIFYRYGNVHHIPIVKDGGLVDIYSRQRVFWKQYFDERHLPRMHYAKSIYYAALEAKQLGYEEVSAIEFGVAGGAGLLNLEFHAYEVSRILGIKIHVYGFDTGAGLPTDNLGYKDMIHIWPDATYKMDYDELKCRLRFAELVIGDLKDTGAAFFESVKPAPICCMLIDVDRYSSTVSILKMLENGDEYFTPRVHMYFDDVSEEYEFSGENLAIKEFNAAHEFMKISPEGKIINPRFQTNPERMMKLLHRFQHEKYNNFQNVFMCIELNEAAYELKLMDIL